MKLQFWEPANLLKKTLTHVFSCEIYKLFKNNYFKEYLLKSAAKLYLKRDSKTGVFLCILCIIQEHLFCRGSMNDSFWNTSPGSLFNKVASLTAWRHLTVLDRDPSTYIFLQILRNFYEIFFAENALSTMSHMILFSFFLFADQWDLFPKSIYFLEQW